MADKPHPSRGPVISWRAAPTELGTWALDIASLVVTLALAVMVAFGVTGTARVLLTLGFVAYVPGRAVIANWPAALARSEVALPVVVSISITTLAAVLGLWLHAWQPVAEFGVEAAASVFGLTVALTRRARASSTPPSIRTSGD